jgi:hypothetical protein
MNRHVRPINFMALNLHLRRQSPQAVHWPGSFIVACMPASFFAIANTWRVHLLTQRPHPVQLLSTMQITLFLFFRRRSKPPKVHSRSTIIKLIYTTFIVLRFIVQTYPQRFFSTYADK